MRGRAVLRILTAAIALPVLLTAGCLTSSEGIDLTERGVLVLTVSRVSGSALATAVAGVTDDLSITSSGILLADDQILYVNDVPLSATARTALGLEATYTATVEGVEAPDTYAISFDNEGVVTSIEVEPPEDFTDVEPDSSDEVERDGFELTWDVSDDDDVTITITIVGSVLSYDDDGNLEVVEYAVSLPGLVDDGGINIGSAELSAFVAGDITVALTRVRTVTPKLGFTEGTIQLMVSHELPLTLVETGEDEDG